MGELEGKVAIVTGAGHGLGRLHAENLAAEGARVVVQDIGADAMGEGRDRSAAQQVVDGIVARGGEAVAIYGDAASFEDSETLVKTALDQYGAIDLLINNAGFTRDNLIYNMSEKDFDDVVRVHLKGHFAPSKFVLTHWREKAKATGEMINGRIVSTASESALFGEPGQPNYAPAKAGIISMTLGFAALGKKYGITANVVMPRARTRMTLKGPMGAMFKEPEEGFDNFNPANSSPFFVYLCTEAAQRISGHVFIVWGREVKLLHRPEVDRVWTSEEPWNLRNLTEAITPHFEKLEPVDDGYRVPPV